jgi:hypothetical protein
MDIINSFQSYVTILRNVDSESDNQMEVIISVSNIEVHKFLVFRGFRERDFRVKISGKCTSMIDATDFFFPYESG